MVHLRAEEKQAIAKLWAAARKAEAQDRGEPGVASAWTDGREAGGAAWALVARAEVASTWGFRAELRAALGLPC